MKTAFVYHRYSHYEQAQGYTLEAQRSITKNLAQKHEAAIVSVYEDEAISAATIDKRPAMVELLNDLPKLKPDYLIVTDQDRISRSNEFWVVKIKLAKVKASIITEKEGIIDQDNATIEAMSDMRAAFSKLERSDIGKRIKRAFDVRISKGLPLGNLKHIFGYDWIKNQIVDDKKIDGKLVINEYEAKIIRLVFDLYNQGRGLDWITRNLNKDYKTPYGLKFYRSMVRHIINRALYCGYVIHHGQLYKGSHEPIISEQTFSIAQIEYRNRYRYNPGKSTKHLLTGFLVCASCGSTLYVGSRTHSYRCSGLSYNKCNDFTQINKDIIEKYIEEAIIEKIRDLKIDIKIDNPVKKPKPAGNEREIINTKLEILATERVDGFISKELYRKKYVELNNQLENLKKTNIKSQIEITLPDFTTEEIYLKSNIIEKRKIISDFIDKIELESLKKNGHRDPEKRVKVYWRDIIS
ncbi:MAG: recombinase family protein [Actinobacteria bacterium]|nr:recombinase family protein [Actinomycetota bacterium]